MQTQDYENMEVVGTNETNVIFQGRGGRHHTIMHLVVIRDGVGRCGGVPKTNKGTRGQAMPP